jgi:hypothetical protein
MITHSESMIMCRVWGKTPGSEGQGLKIQTLENPLPQAWGMGFVRVGSGSAKNTPGLPPQITTHAYL